MDADSGAFCSVGFDSPVFGSLGLASIDFCSPVFGSSGFCSLDICCSAGFDAVTIGLTGSCLTAALLDEDSFALLLSIGLVVFVAALAFAVASAEAATAVVAVAEAEAGDDARVGSDCFGCACCSLRGALSF